MTSHDEILKRAYALGEKAGIGIFASAGHISDDGVLATVDKSVLASLVEMAEKAYGTIEPDPPEEMRKNRWQPLTVEIGDGEAESYDCWYFHIVDNYAMTPDGPKTRYFTFELNNEEATVDVVIALTPEQILSFGIELASIAQHAKGMLRDAKA